MCHKKAHQSLKHHTVFNGKVWGEFICDLDIPMMFESKDPTAQVTHFEVPGTGLSDVQIMEYLGSGKPGHGIHICKLTIFDRPRELSEFRRICKNDLNCESCAMFTVNTDNCHNEALVLKRPPQSWCYVKEV